MPGKTLQEILADALVTSSLAGCPPVLVDVGASGGPPTVWDPIAEWSVYIGFDPDLRALRDSTDERYARELILNEAVTGQANESKTKFYLTRSPYCSSTLPPDLEGLAAYDFAPLFEVVGETEAKATTLDHALVRLGFDHLDWLKLDTQGTDLRLFLSLAGTCRDKVLAVDVEPGLIDAYVGEDLFVDTHREMLAQGFWLSHLNVCGAVRLARTTRAKTLARHPELEAKTLALIRNSPGWCEARYLRTVGHLEKREATQRDFILLWVFALLDSQWGFALDIAEAFERRFGQAATPTWLESAPLRILRAEAIRHRPPLFLSPVKALVPRPIKRWLRHLIGRPSR